MLKLWDLISSDHFVHIILSSYGATKKTENLGPPNSVKDTIHDGKRKLN